MSKGNHPKHPPCPSCGRALYKAPKPSPGKSGAPVKPGDPWAFCRNEKCASFGRNLVTRSGSGPSLPDAMAIAEGLATPADARLLSGEKVDFKKAKAQKGKRPQKVPNKPTHELAPGEPPAVAQARSRIRELLRKAVPEDATPATLGIVLALVSQETGNHVAANALIDEYGLTAALGIAKVEDGKKAKQSPPDTK